MAAATTIMAAAAVAGTAATAYSAYEGQKQQKKAAKMAAQPSTSTYERQPYGNQYLAPLIPYILQEAQNVYQTRAKTGGRTSGAFLPGTTLSVMDILAGITKKDPLINSMQAQKDYETSGQKQAAMQRVLSGQGPFASGGGFGGFMGPRQRTGLLGDYGENRFLDG